MNIIDIVLLAIMLLYVLNGFYRGFLPSIANLGGFFLSWISALIFFPSLSGRLASSAHISSLKFYIEGAEKVGDYELARRALSSFSQSELESAISNASAKLPLPFETAVANNIKSRAFEAEGLTTLGEYFDASIYHVILNIIAFLIIFVVVRVVLTLLINSFTYAASLPELRHFDRTLGGAVSLARAFMSMYVVFALIPIALILVPVTFVTDIVNSSFMSTIFYDGSILLRFLA